MAHYTVFIGRFQPFHRGHYEVVKQALAQSDHLIIVLGSKDRAPALQHPFSVGERIAMIAGAIGHDDMQRVSITSVHDYDYNNISWVQGVQDAVYDVIDLLEPNVAYEKKWPPISLIGHAKDNTSFYLKLFPQWNSIASANYLDLSATDIRKAVYDAFAWRKSPMASFANEAWCKKYFVNDKHFVEFANLVGGFNIPSKMQNLYDQWDFLAGYKEKWWPRNPKTKEFIVPTFNTVDAVVTLGGNILLIQRGNHPGKGQWALPGGFLNQNERIEEAVVRELHEETKLTVPKPALRGAIDGYLVADQIDRDPRGRIISHAYHINLTTYGSDPNSGYKIELPKIKGSDDAAKAKWFTLHEFGDMRGVMFSDHFSIANELINRQSKSK